MYFNSQRRSVASLRWRRYRDGQINVATIAQFPQVRTSAIGAVALDPST